MWASDHANVVVANNKNGILNFGVVNIWPVYGCSQMLSCLNVCRGNPRHAVLRYTYTRRFPGKFKEYMCHEVHAKDNVGDFLTPRRRMNNTW